MRRLSIFSFAWFLLFAWAPARAFLSAGPWPSLESHTVEALVAESPLILSATVRARTLTGGRWHLTLEPIELLKAPSGFPKAPLDATVGGYEDREILPPVGSETLVFLTPWPYGGTTWSTYDIVLLDSSSPALNPYPTRDLTLVPLKDPAQVLSLVRSELQRSPPATLRSVESFNVYPFVLNNLPADERLLPSARRWVGSPDPLARYLAVQVFSKHPDRADIPLLRSLLNDPYLADIPFGLSPWSGHEYLIRQAAAKALTALHEPFGPTPLFVPRTDLYQPLPLRTAAFLFVAVLVVFAVARRLYRRVRRRPPPSRKRSLLDLLTFLSIVFGVCVLLIGDRSYQTADNIVYARHGVLFDFFCLRGDFCFEAARGWPAETPLVHLAIRPNPANLDSPFSETSFRMAPSIPICRWLLPRLSRTTLPEAWRCEFGFAHANDFAFYKRRGISPVCPSFHGVIYFGYLILLGLMLPLFRVLFLGYKQLRDALRLRRLRRRGLCPVCSYDLRSHKPGDKCPECGTVVLEMKPA